MVSNLVIEDRGSVVWLQSESPGGKAVLAWGIGSSPKWSPAPSAKATQTYTVEYSEAPIEWQPDTYILVSGKKQVMPNGAPEPAPSPIQVNQRQQGD